MSDRIPRDRFLLIGRHKSTGKLEGHPTAKWDEAMRVIADDDYPAFEWTAIYDSQEQYEALRLIEGGMLDGLVAEFIASRRADVWHEGSLERTG